MAKICRVSWLKRRKALIKIEIEALTCTTREEALRTNNMKGRIDNTTDCDKNRIFSERGEIAWRIVSECGKC